MKIEQTPRAAARGIAIAILLTLPIAGPSEAQEAAPLALSLEDALRRGFAVGEEVALAQSQVAEADSQVAAARSAAFPQVSAELNYLRIVRTPFRLPSDFEGGDLPFGNENTYTGALRLEQPLYAGGQIGAGLAIARDFSAAARSRATENFAQLGLEIAEAYYDAVLADRLAEITQAQAEQTDDQLRQVRLLHKVGNAANLDVLRVEVERENLEPDLVAALNAKNEALLNLKRLINLPAEAPLDLVDQLTPVGFQPIGDGRLAELAAAGAKTRAAIKAQELQTAIARRQITVVKGEYRPSIGLTASLGKQAVANGGLPAGADFLDDWSVGVGVRVPIFTGGRRRADLAAAKEALKQDELRLAQLEESVALDIRRTVDEVRRAIALITARAHTVEQAEEVYRLTQLAYDQGVTTYLEINDSRLALRQARANEAQALHAYYLSLARFLRAAGAPLSVTTLRLVQTPNALAATGPHPLDHPNPRPAPPAESK